MYFGRIGEFILGALKLIWQLVVDQYLTTPFYVGFTFICHLSVGCDQYFNLDFSSFSSSLTNNRKRLWDSHSETKKPAVINTDKPNCVSADHFIAIIFILFCRIHATYRSDVMLSLTQLFLKIYFLCERREIFFLQIKKLAKLAVSDFRLHSVPQRQTLNLRRPGWVPLAHQWLTTEVILPPSGHGVHAILCSESGRQSALQHHA